MAAEISAVGLVTTRRPDGFPAILDAGNLAQAVLSTGYMVTLDAVEAALERIRPALHADGGDIEVVAFNGQLATVRLTGACSGCPSAEMTLQVGVEGALRRLNPAIRVVLV